MAGQAGRTWCQRFRQVTWSGARTSVSIEHTGRVALAHKAAVRVGAVECPAARKFRAFGDVNALRSSVEREGAVRCKVEMVELTARP